MNVKYLVASLVAVLASAGACAQTVPAANMTRAQVVAELVQARADGSLPLSEASFLPYQFAARASADTELNADAKTPPRQVTAVEPARIPAR